MGVVREYPGRKGGMVSYAISAAGHASIDVELYWVSFLLVNYECTIGGGEELIEPG